MQQTSNETFPPGEIVEGYEFKRRIRYDDLLDGEIHLLTVSQHLSSTRETFRSSLYQAAKRRGIRVRTELVGSEAIAIQALDVPAKQD